MRSMIDNLERVNLQMSAPSPHSVSLWISVYSPAMLAIVRGTSLYLNQPVVGRYEIMNTINQTALSSSDDRTACRFPHTLDHGVVGCCVMIRTSRAAFSTNAILRIEA